MSRSTPFGEAASSQTETTPDRSFTNPTKTSDATKSSRIGEVAAAAARVAALSDGGNFSKRLDLLRRIQEAIDAQELTSRMAVAPTTGIAPVVEVAKAAAVAKDADKDISVVLTDVSASSDGVFQSQVAATPKLLAPAIALSEAATLALVAKATTQRNSANTISAAQKAGQRQGATNAAIDSQTAIFELRRLYFQHCRHRLTKLPVTNPPFSTLSPALM